MALYCFNRSGSPVVLAGLSVTVPASAAPPLCGARVDVTAALSGLTALEYAALQTQALAASLIYAWTGTPGYATGTLAVTGLSALEGQAALDASGGAHDTVVLTHGFGFPPVVYVLKQVGATWVDATGTVDVSHDAAFTATTVKNATAFPLTFLIRLV